MNYYFKQIVLSCTRLIPDSIYLKIMYRYVTGKKLNLKNPRTFNEKLQWLKLHNRKDEYTKMVDKYEVRDYIAQRIGPDYLIPLLGVWDNPEKIDFDCLPNQFVLKCTHDCEGLVVCKNKEMLDYSTTKNVLLKAFRRNFYFQGREWPYKNVKPRIIAEQYMHDDGEDQLTDYKIFCFNGEPKIIQVDYDRFSGHKRQFFDISWNRLDVSFHFKSDTQKIRKPITLEKMLELSRILSEGFPHLRTDFYSIGSKVYVGEMTFFHGTGMGKWTPDSFDMELGDLIDLKNAD